MSQRLVRGQGPIPCRLMLMGEKPGVMELRLGKPFVHKAGQELDGLLRRVGIDRRECYVTNLLKDQPTGKGWTVTREDIERNDKPTREEINKAQPDIIMALGLVPAQWLLGTSLDMHTLHGVPQEIQFEGRRVVVLPAFNPAAALHNPEDYQYLDYDFAALRLVLDDRASIPARNTKRAVYRRVERIAEVDRLFQRAAPVYGSELTREWGGVIGLDTEGHRPKPWGMSFSCWEGEGYVVLTQDRQVIERVFYWIRKRHLRPAMHYAVHDMSVLQALGCPIDWMIDKPICTMLMAWLLCVEPQGLKALAYRHCGMHMKSYEDVVEPYSLELRIKYLEELASRDWGLPEPVIEQAGGRARLRQPQSLNRYLRRLIDDIRALKPGLDVKSRWVGIDEVVRGPAEREFGPLPQAGLELVPLPEAINYSAADADAEVGVFARLLPRIVRADLLRTLEMKLKVLPCIEEMQETGWLVDQGYMSSLEQQTVRQAGRIRHQIRQSANGLGSVNPESSKQVASLLYEQLGLPVLKRTETGLPSTSEEAIYTLQDKHPVVPLILAHRECTKNLGTFIRPFIRAAAASPDGRVRGRIKYTRVHSGRFAMGDAKNGELNFLNIPVRSEAGKEIRNGFVAPEGKWLGSWDLSQIEMRYMAHESQDEELMRAYHQDLDIHCMSASRMFGFEVSKERHPEERFAGKTTGFLIINGGTGYALLDQFRLNGITKYTEEDCDGFIEAWLDTFPGVRRYMSSCAADARRDGWVRDSWGLYRYLPACRSVDSAIRANASRQAISQRIQGGAQGYIQTAMGRLHRQVLRWRAAGKGVRWVLQIHDEVILEFDKGQEREVDTGVKWVLEHAVELRVPVKTEGRWKERWGELK